jgi:hypothetical protein
MWVARYGAEQFTKTMMPAFPAPQTLLSRFWFEVHPDMGTAEEVEAETEAAMVLVPGRPLKMKVTPHAA